MVIVAVAIVVLTQFADCECRYPLVLGGVLPSEEAMGYIQLRFKKHRWHRRILKTRDPIILSIGWRRFQTVPLYACHDRDARFVSPRTTVSLARIVRVAAGA